jgi:peptide/nickel transport system permease protein
MTRYLLKRLFWMVPLLIGISLVSFLIMHLAPGDITTTEAGFNPKPPSETGKLLMPCGESGLRTTTD